MLKTLVAGCAPTRGSKFSVCIDLYASEDVAIDAGETKLVGLGVAIDMELLKTISDRDMENTFGMPCDEIENGDGDADKVYFETFLSSHYLQLMLRSSLSKKFVISNGVGVIDLDYKDEIKIRLHKPLNLFDVILNVFTFGMVSISKTIKKGDKIAQITLLEHKSYLFGIESEEERNGGFGSTGG